MLSVRKSSVLALMVVATASSAASAAANVASVTLIKGSLIGSVAKANMSDADTAKMEEARALFLNSSVEKEFSWVGEKYRGTFKPSNPPPSHYVIEGQNINCVVYIHSLMDKTTGQVIMEPDVMKVDPTTNKPREFASNIRGKVCFIEGQWQKYTAEMGKLVAASSTTSSAASDRLPPPAPAGEDYHNEYPNIANPITLGQIVHNFKRLELQLDETLEQIKKTALEKDPKFKFAADFREKTELSWITITVRGNKESNPPTVGMAEDMAKNNRYLGRDQLALILKEIQSEKAKHAAVEGFAAQGRIDNRVGDESSVLTQFNDSKLRNLVREMVGTAKKAPSSSRSRRSSRDR